jgi:hypothetical protein
MKDPEKVIMIKISNHKDNSLTNHWLTEEEFEMLKKAVSYLKDNDLDYLFSIKRTN